jgi:purine-binding chemotaxis protein CheW
VSDIRPPDDSLSSYFDELLKGDLDNHAQIDLPLAVGENFASSNVVSLNSRQKNSPAIEKKSPALRETSKPGVKSRADYAEPALSQDEQDKKQKLEKLLQTAQQQFLKQEQATQPQTLTKTLVEMPEEIQDWPIETKTEVVEADKAIEVQLEQKIAHTEEVESEIQFSEIPNLEWAANGLPQWAQERFDVLLFNVAGLTLAVPLIALGQIYPLTDELTPLFGQADWFMGLQPTSMGKIRTVNTARFVMPEKYNESFLDNTKYVMSLNGVLWGLALDSVNQPMRLDPDQVKWRKDRTKRPWLAGTVKDHMCALLDVPRIAQLLLDADRNHKRR